jgi:ferredoxin-NADP reductase
MLTSLVVGRTKDNDLVIPSPFLSSTHAQIDLVDLNTLTFRIEDLGSTNGTSVNGEAIDATEFRIGDVVMLGEYELKPADYLFYFLEHSGGTATPQSTTRPLYIVFAATLGAVIGVWASSGYFGISNFGSVALEAIALIALVQIIAYVVLISHRAWRRRKFDVDYYRQQHEGLIEKLSFELNSKMADQQIDDHTWTGFRKFEVVQRVPECRDVTSFYLQPHDNKAIPSFYPGQYLTVRLKIPGKEGDVIRCYSLSDAFGQDQYRVSIKRAPPPSSDPEAPSGLASSFFHEQIQEGDILDVKAPSGKFYLDVRNPEGVVLLAGGVGVTPMLAMANALVQRGSRQPIWFFYGVKNSLDLVQAEFLRKVAERNDNFHLVVCFSKPADYETIGEDYDYEGHVSIDLVREKLETNNYQFYVCGSGPFMQSLTIGLDEWGVPKSKVNMEAFGPSSIGKKESTLIANDERFTLEFARSKNKVDASTGATILEIAEQNQISIDFGCRVGNCGTCSIAIRKGSVKYDESHDADVEEGSCLACIARPASDLVLDL